ncbi:MAG: Hsp70 family protein [Leptospirillum sp.]
MKEIIIGIDLGTTNSEVAVVRNGSVEVIPISEDLFILPSVVGIGDDGALLVGDAAKNQYLLHPERTVRSVKRRMGEFTKITMGDKEYAPQEISAMILRKLKKTAEDFLGQPVGKAVITVPAFFSDAQRQATREAGEIAGLEVVRVINEPTAAALTYESRTEKSVKALVYDLGGGTFDVSVVNMEGEVVEVLASHGNNQLGGDDFDLKIVDYLIGHLKKAHEGIDPAADQIVMARLFRAAEAAKMTLSDFPYAAISEEYLMEHKGIPVHLQTEISRSEYESLVEPYIDETIDAVHVALSGARLMTSQIDEILLVGGSTRTPLIVRRLEEDLGILPRGEMNPDLCVAMGAAIQASIISGEETPKVLVDVTPYTFGVSALADFDGELYPYSFIPLIRKNTPIPVSKSEVFYTAVDGQKAVEVHIFQGEDPDALNNIEIGSFLLEGLQQEEASGSPIVATFSLDLDGILHVTTREKKTDLEKSLVIDNAIGRSEEKTLDGMRERVESMFGEVAETVAGTDEREDQRVRTKVRALLEKAERLMEKAIEEDREDLQLRIESLDNAIDGSRERLELAMNELSDLIYYLEQ